jgi:hypothetical protein
VVPFPSSLCCIDVVATNRGLMAERELTLTSMVMKKRIRKKWKN